jgi:hypothetical protein
MAAYAIDDILYRNMDGTSPDKFLLMGQVSFSRSQNADVATCYVYLPRLVRGQPSPNVFDAIGRTSIVRVSTLEDRRRFVPVSRPFVIRRDDGHEVSYEE